MKDLFAEFKKATLKQHLTIGVTAFAFALGVNYLLFATDTGVKLQASAIEASGTSKVVQGPDFVVSTSPGTDRLTIKISKAVVGAKSLEFTLLTNPVAVNLGTAQMAGGVSDDTPTYAGEAIRTVNISGVAQYRVNFSTPTDITAGASIVTVAVTRTGSWSTPINVAGVRVFTNTGDFELSSIWSEVK